MRNWCLSPYDRIECVNQQPKKSIRSGYPLKNVIRSADEYIGVASVGHTIYGVPRLFDRLPEANASMDREVPWSGCVGNIYSWRNRFGIDDLRYPDLASPVPGQKPSVPC